MRVGKFDSKSFDVGCVQCGYSHSHQQVPFACVAQACPVWMRPKGFGFEFAGSRLVWIGPCVWSCVCSSRECATHRALEIVHLCVATLYTSIRATVKR